MANDSMTASSPTAGSAPTAIGAPTAAGASAAASAPAALDLACEQHEACGCRHKDTPRSRELQGDLQRRLNRAIGQLNGIKGMIDDNRYCGDVLVQLAAVESAVRSVSVMLLQDHLETCVVEQVRQGNDDVIDEAVQLVKKFVR